MVDFQKWILKVFNSFTSSVRRFSFMIMIIFTVGILLGSRIQAARPEYIDYAIGIPVILAILSYLSTAFAMLVFGLFVLIFLFLV
ncbi:hypothetical protein HY993_03450 [Candidatus Micrarchaeota archaeon]|nr:hypothetical protein [Candidatus Micrarchaeota archaeon]